MKIYSALFMRVPEIAGGKSGALEEWSFSGQLIQEVNRDVA